LLEVTVEDGFGVSRWTLFGQAVRFLHDDLLRSDSGRLPQLRQLLEQAHGLLKTDLYASFESALREAFAAQLSYNSPRSAIGPHFFPRDLCFASVI
jgi:hypothetical protein